MQSWALRIMKVVATAALATWALMLAFASEASAYCRSTTCRTTATRECATDRNECVTQGAKLFWPTSCVGFSLQKNGTQDLDPQETFSVLRKAFQAWSEVPCPGGGNASITFEERGPVACKRSEFDKGGRNLNVVLFQDDDWKYRGADATLAKTSVSYNDETGEIYDADIEINAAYNTLTMTNPPELVEYDLQAIVTHEVGHFLGIAHSSDGSAVMNATYEPGSVLQRTLASDDVAAVCGVYPPDRSVACNSEPHGGFRESCNSDEQTDGCSLSGRHPVGNRAVVDPLTAFGLAGLAVLRRGRRRGAPSGRLKAWNARSERPGT